MSPLLNLKRYSLTGGQNSYANPASSDAEDARKLQSLIPSLSAQLERERPTIPFAIGALPSRVGFFHLFKWKSTSGSITFFFFCATATQLYQLNGAPGSGNWNLVSQVGTLVNFPVARNIDNTMHLSDGVSNFIFDGVNWTTEGLAIPLHSPGFTAIAPPNSVSITSITRSNNTVTAVLSSAANLLAGMNVAIAAVTDTSFNGDFELLTVNQGTNTVTWQQFELPNVSSSGGTLSVPPVTILSNRFYWTTFADESTTRRPHESSSSPISLGTGPNTTNIFKVTQRFGTVSTSDGENFTGVGTDFSSDDVGQILYTPTGSAKIAFVFNATTLALGTPVPVVSGVNFVIAPPRATHWNVYASSSEEDKVGNFLAQVPITQTVFIDSSQMIGTAGALFSSVQRPLLDDPPNPSLLMEVFSNRIWRRVEGKFKNFFSFSAYEEVLAQLTGNPYESLPGADPNTRDPGTVNEQSYPDQSVELRGLCAHGAALYIGSESNVIPLYGNSLSSFALSPYQAFAVGFAGRNSNISTPFGLAFVSYDLKVYLYPSQYSFGVDSTTALVELSRPIRLILEQAKGSDLDNIHLKFYNWGRRNWLVLSFQDNTSNFQTWIFDFETKGWTQLQQGYTALYVFEVSPGLKSLVGATTDFNVVVIDDNTLTFPVPGTATYPQGIFRQIVDFGEPNSNYVLRPIEFEVDSVAFGSSIQVRIYLDPSDPDNPTNGIPVTMSQMKVGSNRFKGVLNSDTGATCQRALVEFLVPASKVAGKIRGYSLFGEKVAVDNPAAQS